MARTVAIGVQDFEKLRVRDNFYVDKTDFIREWWESADEVTLITRPRRFGKTLNMSMLNCFFSDKYAGRADLFEGLNVWKDEKYRALQGTYPVIFLSFAGVKGKNYADTVAAIKKQIVELYDDCTFLYTEEISAKNERVAIDKVTEDMSDVDAEHSLNLLTRLMEKHYGKKVLIFLDEYDTPLQEAYINGYWDELIGFIRSMFNNTFKTNPALERAVMTGITRVSKESIFSDLNNLTVVTTTSNKYATAFGFTEEEVFASMDEQGIAEEEKALVKSWYDGFTFGNYTDIYNPWSVTMYLDEKKIGPHWANTSGNGLVGHLLKTGNNDIKEIFESLLQGGAIETQIDEQIIFNQLEKRKEAIWSLLLASGYLKVLHMGAYSPDGKHKPIYHLTLTNLEVRIMFEDLISAWFDEDESFNDFVRAMFAGDAALMNRYMNDVALNTFSSFDGGTKPSEKLPERFYHGFVLGILVDQAKDYLVKSNRESGYGRYDVVLEPKDEGRIAIIMEFKVFDTVDGESTLEDTASNALKQIEEKKYDSELLSRGIPAEHIYKYALVFEGKKCLIRKA